MSSTFPEIIENTQENITDIQTVPNLMMLINQAVKNFSFQMVDSNSIMILCKYIFKIGNILLIVKLMI